MVSGHDYLNLYFIACSVCIAKLNLKKKQRNLIPKVGKYKFLENKKQIFNYTTQKNLPAFSFNQS